MLSLLKKEYPTYECLLLKKGKDIMNVATSKKGTGNHHMIEIPLVRLYLITLGRGTNSTFEKWTSADDGHHRQRYEYQNQY